MSEQDTDGTGGGLSPQPAPSTQEPELFPGGADAVRDESEVGDGPSEPVTRDLDPEDNPAVTDATPDDITAGDDKQQEPDDDERGEDADSPDEPPA